MNAMSVRECVARQPGEGYDPAHQSVVKKTLAALGRAGIQTALELQQTPPAFLLHLWGCSENSIRWLDRRMKARLGSGFARREVFLDAEQDWRVRNDAVRHALAATLADVEQWRPGLLKAEKKYAADRLAERWAKEEQERKEKQEEEQREKAEEAARRKVAENKAQVEAAKEAQTFSFKPFDQITYREWLIGQLSVGHGLQPKPVLAQIVASADELICLAQTGVCESKVAKQDITSLPEYQYLPVRVRKCLVAAKIQTLLDLSMRNPYELLRIKNVGVTSICDLMKLLEAYGMTFPVRWP